MSNEKFWDRHDPFLVMLGIICIVVISVGLTAFGLLVYNSEPAWHDLGKVESITHTFNYTDNSGLKSWVTLYNATIFTQNHGNVTVVSHLGSCYDCPSIDWTMKVNDTVGVIRTNGGEYGVTVLG